MYTRHTDHSGAALAIGAAGPLFLTGTAIAAWMDNISAPVSLSGDTIYVGVLVLLVGFSTIFGSILAALPVMIGTKAMIWLGRRNTAMRLPVAWALAGGITTAPLMIFTRLSTLPPAFAVIFTGTACGLISRWRVTWRDDAPRQALPLSQQRSPAICT